MYYSQKSSFEPSFWMFEKENEWIKFPWEISLQDVSINALNDKELEQSQLPSVKNPYQMNENELDNYVCWNEPGIPTALASAMSEYWNGDVDNFYSWVLNIAHRMFVASAWDRVIDYEDMQTHENYAVLAKCIGAALVECSDLGYPDCLQSKEYKKCVLDVSEAIKGAKSKSSMHIRDNFDVKKSNIACTASIALRYYFLAKYHAQKSSLRNPEFDWKSYDRAVASISTEEYKAHLCNYVPNNIITHKELSEIVKSEFKNSFPK